MNLDEKTMKEWGYVPVLQGTENMLERIFRASDAFEVQYVTDTYQFDDYAKYVVTVFDEAHKAKIRKEEFPKDCDKAFDMGKRFAGNRAN
jgi:hypothetical protein